jgi:hypothetical protein
MRIVGAFAHWKVMVHDLKCMQYILKRAAQRMMKRRLKASWQGGVTLVLCQLFSAT